MSSNLASPTTIPLSEDRPGVLPDRAIVAMIEAGADVLVAGSAVFAQADYAAAIQALRPSYSV